MGWSWDHTKTRETRSYTAHHELGQHLSQIAPGWAWRAVKPLWEHSSDQFDIQPGDATRMAEALTALAPLTNDTWTHAVRDLAAAAREAGRTGSLWHWS